jgi:hypothetical protein
VVGGITRHGRVVLTFGGLVGFAGRLLRWLADRRTGSRVAFVAAAWHRGGGLVLLAVRDAAL